MLSLRTPGPYLAEPATNAIYEQGLFELSLKRTTVKTVDAAPIGPELPPTRFTFQQTPSGVVFIEERSSKLTLLYSSRMLPRILTETVLADIVWPGLMLMEGWFSLPVILVSLLIEWPFFKFIFKAPWDKALAATLLANACSGVAGILLVPAATLVMEIFPPKSQPEFGIANDIQTTFVAAFICTAIEYPVAAKFLKGQYRFRSILLLYLANIITVGLAAYWSLILHAKYRS